MEARYRLKRAIDDLLDVSVALEEAVDRQFTSDFRQTVNGLRLDRVAFVAGIESLRQQLIEARVTVVDEVVEERRYAERHRIELTPQDGSRMAREVYAFTELDAERK